MRFSPNLKCSVENCGLPAHGRALCHKHYMRNFRNGSPTARKPRKTARYYPYTDWKGYRVYDLRIGTISEQRIIVECVLGKPKPPQAVIHHVNGMRQDNRNANLVVCPNGSYHSLLHARTKALDECGNANLRKCYLCGKWEDPSIFPRRGKKNGYTHLECRRVKDRERLASKRVP